jgi:hypothetical protein
MYDFDIEEDFQEDNNSEQDSIMTDEELEELMQIADEF